MVVPRIYQTECLTSIAQARLEDAITALVVMATRLGKTITAALDVEQYLKGRRAPVLYLCHKTDILDQAFLEFKRVFGDSRTYGFFHGKKKDFENVDFLFCSFDTIANWMELFDPEMFEYIIVDESHHSPAATYLPIIKHFRPKFMLAITATPNRMDEKDITEIYGKPVYELPLEKALALGYLTPVDYRMLTDEVQLSETISAREGQWSISALNRQIFIPKRDEEIAQLIAEYTKDVKDLKMIVFCSSVKHCDRLVGYLPDSLALHSKIPQKERDLRLEMFRQRMLNTVVTVDCFNEGIDIPRANVIVFLRSTASATIFLQQLGRGLTKEEEKERVLVLDFVANLERIKMIELLMKEVKKHTPPPAYKKPDQAEPFIVDIGKVFFKERKISMIDLLERILKKEFYPTWVEASEAALKLGIKNSSEYKKRYKEDPRLPSGPHKAYAGWPGWHVFLRMFYPTLAEAKAAALKLGINSSANYLELRDQDPMLPSGPSTYYADWPGWGPFLDKGEKRKTTDAFYATYAEASEAAQKLGFKTMLDYLAGYRSDPKLPSNPNQLYSADWKGGGPFLGFEEPYATVAEASAAAKKLGIKTQAEFAARYKEDPRFASVATTAKLAGFPGWSKFLGRNEKYETLAEATGAVRRLEITSVAEYEDRYKEDPLLPASPHQFYSDWEGWPTFFGNV